MDGYIKREDAIRAIKSLPDCQNGYSDAYDKATIIGVLEDLPTADVVERKKWIPVTERLPEKKKAHYLCYLDDDSIAVCYWSNISIHGSKWEWHNPNWKDVTHWMPLPEPPKEAET